ncbi:MAG: chorismate synthase [bacterium]|nr:MAG: chorismate synthase [bacterium]
MSGNIYGSAFRVMTFGESHGPYIGLVIDGLRPGLPIDTDQIQYELDRRRPGQSSVVTPRKETDQAKIISGVFEGKTTGTPICILIQNQDQRSGDYQKLRDILRPGHAAYSFLEKYGIFDYRGGGRASGRETATRVAAGAVAKQFLKSRGIEIFGYTRRIGEIEIQSIDLDQIEKNPVRSADATAAKKMTEAILQAQNEGDSLGGVIEIQVKNCPSGLGEPVFNKLEADLAQVLMSIGAVKAFEMGDGFQAASMKGSEFNDNFYFNKKKKRFSTRTNHAGGVLGGITNGEDLIMRITVKPPSSIRKEQDTVDNQGNPVKLTVEGRHDSCICPRIVPVAEAMVALVLIDHILMQERLSNESRLHEIRHQIDMLDMQFILLLAQRRNLIRKIAEFKAQNSRKVHDAEREEFKVRQWQEQARTLDIPKDLVDSIFTSILSDSHHLQGETLK